MTVEKTGNQTKFGYALRESDNRSVHISEVENGKKCGCICRKCKGMLIAKHGKIREHHFAHEQLSDCKYEGETDLHLRAKEILFAEQRISLQRGEYQFYTVELESAMPGSRMMADVFMRGKFDLVIEIFVTHRNDIDKDKFLQGNKIRSIEIDLSKVPRNIDPENLKEIVCNDISIQREIFWPPTDNERRQNDDHNLSHLRYKLDYLHSVRDCLDEMFISNYEDEKLSYDEMIRECNDLIDISPKFGALVKDWVKESHTDFRSTALDKWDDYLNKKLEWERKKRKNYVRPASPRLLGYERKKDGYKEIWGATISQKTFSGYGEPQIEETIIIFSQSGKHWKGKITKIVERDAGYLKETLVKYRSLVRIEGPPTIPNSLDPCPSPGLYERSRGPDPLKQLRIEPRSGGSSAEQSGQTRARHPSPASKTGNNRLNQTN